MGGLFIRRRKEQIAAPQIVDRTVRAPDLSPVGDALAKTGKGIGDLGKGIGDLARGLLIAQDREDEKAATDAYIKLRKYDSELRNGTYSPEPGASENGVTKDGEQLPFFEPYGLHGEVGAQNRIPGIQQRRGLDAQGGTREWQDKMRIRADELTKDFSKEQKERFWRKTTLFYEDSRASMTQWEIREMQHGAAKQLETDMTELESCMMSDFMGDMESLKEDREFRDMKVQRAIDKHVAAGKSREEADMIVAPMIAANTEAVEASRNWTLQQLLNSRDQAIAEYLDKAVYECGMSIDEARDSAIVLGRAWAMKAISYIAEQSPDDAQWLVEGIGLRDTPEVDKNGKKKIVAQELPNRTALDLTEEDAQKALGVIRAARKRKDAEAKAAAIDLKRAKAEAQDTRYNEMFWQANKAKTAEEMNAVIELLDSPEVQEQFKDQPQAIHTLKRFAQSTIDGWESDYAAEQKKQYELKKAMTKAEADAEKARIKEMEGSIVGRVLEIQKMQFNGALPKDIAKAQVELATLFNLAQEQRLLPPEFLQGALDDLRAIRTADERRALNYFDRAFGIGSGRTETELRKLHKDKALKAFIAPAGGGKLGEVPIEDYFALRGEFLQQMREMPGTVNREQYAQKLIDDLRVRLIRQGADDAIEDLIPAMARRTVDAQTAAEVQSNRFIDQIAAALGIGKKTEKKEDKGQSKGK